MAKVIKNAISSEYLRYKIDEDISIYEGRFCIYLDRKYRCSGIIYYKMTPPISINFKAQILFVEDEDVDLELDYDNAILEMYGYKPISITINARNDFNMEGYINDNHIKSKNSFVDYVDFNIVNLDKFPGDLIKHVDKLFAGRIEFDIGDFHITIDKRYDYRRELNDELKSKSGFLITHIGRIRRKDNRPFKTNSIINFLDRISTALSFMCGRYIGICLAKGYKNNNNTYRLWIENIVTPFRFVPTWTDTISNHHNIEKYLSLMCNKLEDGYYGPAIKHVIDWYIESLGDITLENNIPHGSDELELFDDWIRGKFDDGVDLVIYFRNKIVHPVRKDNRANLTVEDMWNIIQIGTKYIELIVLSFIGYKGEYSNRLKERWFGEVEVVPWNKLD